MLPLSRVRLFENGIGYFERSGTLTAAAALLPVPASHVDDALKTLVVLSNNSVTVSGIEFASLVSGGTARALAGLRLSDETPLGYEDVLSSLEGYRVRLTPKNGAQFSGRLIDVQRFERIATAGPPRPPRDVPASGEGEPGAEKESETPKAHPMEVEDHWLFVVSDAGSLRRIPASEVTEILPLDPGFSSRLRTATDALSGRAAQLARQLRVLAGAGAPVRLGYVAEAPVWRASYRLVLDAERDTAMVQGWALIHNDTDEAWSRVNIELVNGQPDSFLFPMAAPRYTRRPMTTPEEQLSTVPQLALKTPDAIWGDHAEEEEGEGGLGIGGIESVGSVGYGAGAGGLVGAHHVAGRALVSDSISIGDLASVAKAKAVQESLLFSYRLADPVSLRAHGSALLPFFDQALEGKRLTRFETGETQGRATIRLVNVSRNTLPAGPLAVYESAGFSGETVLARLRPGGRVFLNYGMDLDTEFREKTGEITRETLQVAFHETALDEHYVKTRQVTLSFENHSPMRRTVAYALRGTVSNAQISGADTLDYDSDTSTALALFEVGPGARSERQLRVREALKDRLTLDQLNEEALARMTKAPALEAPTRAALTAAAVVVKSLRAEREREQRLIQERSQLDEDLARHREHLKAAGSNDGMTNPLTKRIVELEGQRARIRSDLEELSRRMTALRRQVAAELQRLPKQEPK